MEEDTFPVDIGWQPKVVIGRLDPQTRRTPDISLDFLDAAQNGVSRRHALLFWRNQVLCIEDLGSTNGTWVNGAQLFAHLPHSLSNGDVIKLGQVLLHLRFNPNHKYPPTFLASLVNRV